jgi:hypothetical protein
MARCGGSRNASALHTPSISFGFDRSGRDRIHGDTEVGQVERSRAGQADHARLGGARRREVDRA